MNQRNNADKQIRGNLLLTAHEAAEYLNISRQWLANQRWRGTGPKYIKIGGAVRYQADDLDRFIVHSSSKSKGYDHCD